MVSIAYYNLYIKSDLHNGWRQECRSVTPIPYSLANTENSRGVPAKSDPPGELGASTSRQTPQNTLALCIPVRGDPEKKALPR